MPTDHIVALLIQERDKLDRAIELLQGEKRRGRPPRNSVAEIPQGAGVSSRTPIKKTSWTPARRKAQAERIKAYWAKKRKATK
jgi:hypothetical protein